MNSMKECFGYKQNADVSWAISRIGRLAVNYNWLLVAIDSIKGRELLQTKEAVEKLLEHVQADFQWRQEGLWIRQNDILKAIDAKLLVGFSALYLFNATDDRSSTPTYSLTSESERFEDTIPLDLVNAVQTIGARGYLADGCGLNYYLLDEPICSSIQTGVTH